MAKALMILGTGSDVGKSIATAAFCRIFKRRGFKVAPFKAQNMSNNSFVTVEGGEIGRAQVVQAEAAGVLPSVHMNPILLKPSTHLGAQIIVQGEVFGQMDADHYLRFKPKLRKAVLASYKMLARDYELIIMEGAGSCCEMNLKKNDLVNFPMAKAVAAPCILVADIDRGGVFAQIMGSYHLMSRKERTLTAGFLINKFRGDPQLFSSGIKYLEEKTKKPVLGLVPFYQDIFIDPEDSVAVQEDKRSLAPIGPETVNVAVIKLPAISNFTDLACLETEPDVVVNYLVRPRELTKDYDCIVLPGTKNVMEDASWLAKSGWRRVIRQFAERGGRILGICGGYQLMGSEIKDPFGVESSRKTVRGIGLLPVKTELGREKVVQEVTGSCLLNRKRIRGYEIHMGKSWVHEGPGKPYLQIRKPGHRHSWKDGWCMEEGHLAGTYVHGILDSPGFRAAFLNKLRKGKGLKERGRGPGRRKRFQQYDRLADHFERYCDVDRILSYIGTDA